MRVLIGHEVGLGLLGELPSAADVAVWDGRGTVQGEGVEMWVAPLAPWTLGEVLPQLPDLRVLQLMTAGYEHVIADLPAEITLCNAGQAHDGAVAEWSVAAILAVKRALPVWLLDQATGAVGRFQSGTLVGANVLLIGYGGIGKAVARRLEGFEAEVVPVASRARDGVHGVEELPELLPKADVVVLSVPLTETTRGLVDARFLELLPDGALLVNASRGAVVDQEALEVELVKGRLRAALDVSYPEPLPAGHPLRGLRNVLYTPHIAGATDTLFPRLFTLVGEQIRRLCAGDTLENVVPR
jgi:phosphoglycerate dehydrogenase-like enzyme